MASSVFADSPVSTNESRMCGETSADLVVVYGKKGVNVDSNALNNLLEDRNISSVSVVRITSPTPSMQDEEDEEHEDEEISGDDSDLTAESKNMEKPEIVGLTVEEFYPREEAKKLAKEILNYAGVANPLQIKIDYEFQRFVIQNDHCYTPLTSPSQSKPKIPADVATTSDNKMPQARPTNTTTIRARKTTDTATDADEKRSDSADEDDEYSDYSDSSLSAESDNDRDSDLDFSVNDRGRRRKTRTKKTRKSITKTPRKQRQSVTEKDNYGDDEQKKPGASIRSNIRQSLSMQNAIKTGQKTPIATKLPPKPVQRLPSTELDKAQTCEQKPRVVQTAPLQKALQQQQHIQQRQQQIQMQIQQQQHLIQQQIQQQQKQEAAKIQAQKVYLFKKETPATPTRVADNTFVDLNPGPSVSAQHVTVKQIVNIPSQSNPSMQLPSVSVSSVPHFPSQSVAAKGFMPLVVETAVKNQLPAQISIQTHTSSTELAIENDKQLDLIDSIVKDEMQKTNVVMVKHTQETNKDIPQIVKMLESTESAILNTKPNIQTQMGAIPSTSASGSFTQPVEHFDIANADLLDNPDDDLYKDLLQHVAELRNDQHLQEVIGKQGFGGSTSSPLTITEGNHQGQQNHSQQMAQGVRTINDPQVPIAKKDPIKIVRGDGRVITLPPIEAPTTRAKRRAQIVPASGSPASTSTPKPVTAAVKTDSSQRRDSGEQRTAIGNRKRVSVSSQSTNKDEEMETEDSQDDSEDDPNKLWCICRQPHNNRFMICCDKCEDWFHGTCVNITKAMGREMENTGKEWTCPNCLKDKKKPIQKKITEIFDKKPGTPTAPPKMKPIPRKISSAPKKSTAKKNAVEPTAKSVAEVSQRKITDTMKVAFKQSGPPPLVKSVETIHGIRNDASSKLGTEQHHASQGVKTADASMRTCIVCKKSSRPNSIYCSDDCIRRHAQNALITVNKAAKAAAAAAAATTTSPVPLTPEDKKKKFPSSFEEALARASENTLPVKTKVERVYVFERKTGRILTGTNAPTTANLKKWLQENPTFEVVQPNSPEAMAIERSKQKHLKIGPLNVSTPQTSSSLPSPSIPATPPPPLKKLSEPKPEIKPELTVRLQKITMAELSGKVQRPQISEAPPRLQKQLSFEAATKIQHVKQNSENASRSPVTVTPPLKKYPQQVSIKPANTQATNEGKMAAKLNRIKQQNQALEQKNAQPVENQPKTDNEPVRLNVRKTLKEQLLSRMNEMKLPETSRLSANEVENFASDVENEMYALFNKDTGAKYRAKYRSLMFNIRDRKNQTLFKKIMERKLQPRQLVRMSPEEMASQELAQWRQNENKHQLEMIKKSELDLLSCAKNYVLKTHKGEEVIESKSTDRVSLDISIPVEDVVTVLNNSVVSSTSETELMSPGKEPNRSQSLSDVSQDADSIYNSSSATESSKLTGQTDQLKEKKKAKSEKERERDRHFRPKEKHKTARKRSRSRSRDRRHKSPYHEERQKSPNREEKRKSPNREERRKSMYIEQRQRSPHRDDRHRSPHRSEKHKSPQREDRHKSPHRSEKHKSPQREDRNRSSPHANDRHKSPHRDEGRHKSPHRDEGRHKSPRRDEGRHKSPHRDDGRKSPHKFEKAKSPRQDSNSESKAGQESFAMSSKKDDNKEMIIAEKSADKPLEAKFKNVPKSHPKLKEKEVKTQIPETCNIIDQIIESSKTVEEAANLFSAKEKTESKSTSVSSAVSTSTSALATPTMSRVSNSVEASSGAESDQEPTSTVNIPTRPEDQYKKYVSDLPSILWSGSINMIDVATFQIVIQPVAGITVELEKQLPIELDVVGRISPDTVWDYIAKIKKSPNKEIVIVRLVPSCESENAAYFALYKYLNNRKRLGVVKTISPNMKDFYILPLSAGKSLPGILQPQESVEFFEDDTRPDLLLGIIIRIMGKRAATASGHVGPSKVARKSNLTSVISNAPTVSTDDTHYTPPGSPKMLGKKSDVKSILSTTRLPPKSDDSIDINSIINPVTKATTAAYTGDDADEPYSPGGSSDDDTPMLSKLGSGVSTDSLTDEDLKRKMDEINRQIEARKMEIAGMLGIDQNSSSYSTGGITELKPALANISIPSNLQQILASLKPSSESAGSGPPPPSIGPLLGADEDEEYVPEPASASVYKPLPPPPPPPVDLLPRTEREVTSNNSSSRLAQLSEAELLSMVPDDIDLKLEPTRKSETAPEPSAKKIRWQKEPPPPGLEEDFI